MAFKQTGLSLCCSQPKPSAQPSLGFVWIFKIWQQPLINFLFLYQLVSADIGNAEMPTRMLKLSKWQFPEKNEPPLVFSPGFRPIEVTF